MQTQNESQDLPTLTLDGEEIAFTPGETVYEVATRTGKTVPTLCYDPRLEAFGSCRLCVVEIAGQGAPPASCTTRAEAAMEVTTASPKVEGLRRTLLELVASENREVTVDALRGVASQELGTLVDQYDAGRGRFAGAQSGSSRTDDPNPFILRDYDLCISCYRCVRVLRGTGRRLRHQHGQPRLRDADHGGIQRPFAGFGLHILRPVCTDLPDRRAGRQEGASLRAGRNADRRALDAGKFRGANHSFSWKGLFDERDND